MNETKHVVAVTGGDPNGIGYEVTLKALADEAVSRLLRPLLVGSYEVFDYYNRRLPQPLRLAAVPDPELVLLDDEVIKVWQPQAASEFEPAPGRVTRSGGAVAGASILAAGRLAQRGVVEALVTAPVSKEALVLAGYPSPGHTELLASLCNDIEAVTMLVWEKLRCALYTLHCPLRAAAEALERDRIVRKLRVVDAALNEWFGIEEARIALCGLNPHASDGGLFGSEEIAILTPTVQKASKEGLHISGPAAPELLFQEWNTYDCIFALYHDQGVVPMMVASKGQACYLTAGLPFLRVGPGHGTAFDIAGKMIADGTKMRGALNLAAILLMQRRQRRGADARITN